MYNSTNGNKGTNSSIVAGNCSITFTNSQTKNETYNVYIDLSEPDWTDKELTDLTETIEWFSNVIVGSIENLFGAGFQSSPNGFILLNWSYTGNVSNYEVQYSNDSISWGDLAFSSDHWLNDTGLLNGSYRYHRVRSTFQFMGSWFNSSWSDTNLERVWFVTTGGAGGYSLVNFIGLILMVIGYIVGLTLRGGIS